MRRWYLLLILFFVMVTSVYKFWALQRTSGITLTSAITTQIPKPLLEPIDKISIMTFNVAMKSRYFYWEWFKHGFFPHYIKEHLDKIAHVIQEAKPDVVILTEIPQEMLPFEQRLVGYLADKAGMHAWIFGENEDQLIGFIRYVGGNAILSRYPLQYNPPMPNSLLSPLATLNLPSGLIWIAGMHNDYKNWQLNVHQIAPSLGILGKHPSVLAGSFNVPSELSTLKLLDKNQLFNNEFHFVPFSFADDSPIINDYIFTPTSWSLIEQRTIANKISTHKALLSTFKIKS